MRILRLVMQVPQQVPRPRVKKGTKASPDWHRTRYEPGGTRGYNQAVEFVLRDFRPQEFETVWRIDQKCFPPGVSYSRLELAAYLRRPGAFYLWAEWSPTGGESSTVLGFIVAETGSRGSGHIITI